MALDLVAGRASLEVRALSWTVLGWRNKRGWSLRELEDDSGDQRRHWQLVTEQAGS